MKINITNKEYRALLTMLEIAQWVIEAHNIEHDGERGPYWELEHKFLALAKDYGCQHLVVQGEEGGHLYPSGEFEKSDPYRRIIDQYTEDTFWEELEDRLVRRDMVRLYGLKAHHAMEPMEGPFREHYDKEFAENGIARLEISESVPGLGQLTGGK